MGGVFFVLNPISLPLIYTTLITTCVSLGPLKSRWQDGIRFFRDLGGRKSGEGAEDRDGFQTTVAGVLTQSPCNQRFERSIPMDITDPESFHPEDLSFFIVLKSSAFSQCIGRVGSDTQPSVHIHEDQPCRCTSWKREPGKCVPSQEAT